MNCAHARPLLGAHLDNELDVRSSLEIEAHLADCAACRAELADLRTLHEAAAVHLERFAPTSAFAARLATAVPRKPRSRAGWLAGAAIGTLAVAALVLLLVRPGENAARRLGDEIVDAHTRSLLADHATDVVSSDQHTVKPWFNGKVPFGVPVTDFAAAGFPLVYRRRNHLVNAFVWPQASDEGPSERVERGYAVLHYARGGLAWWLVSDASSADLRELERLLAAP